jgi:hypothetical protein
MDAATGGNFLYIGDLTTSVTISGGAPSFAVGQLVIEEANTGTSYTSNYLATILLNWIFNGTSPSPLPPSTLYLALFTNQPAADGTGGTEVTIGSNGYARFPVTANTTNFPLSVNSTCPNGATLSPTTEPTGAWGTETIKSVAIMDALTAGNFLLIGSTTLPTSLINGSFADFFPGALVPGES